MKWSWGWKGAAIALALWVVYLLLLLGLARNFPAGSGTKWPHELPKGSALWSVRVCQIALAWPGEKLINAVWLYAGRRLYPRIDELVSGGPGGLQGRWQLYPYVGFVTPPKRYPGFALSFGVRPGRVPFAAHIVMLPAVVMGALGLVVGWVLALLNRRFGGSARRRSPEASGPTEGSGA